MSDAESPDLVTQAEDRPLRLTSELCRLSVVEGDPLGLKKEFSRGTIRIGSLPSNDIVLEDPAVSRYHCQLRATQDGVRIIDCKSTNGTWVDGVRVGEAWLNPSALVKIGATTIRFQSLGRDRAVEVPLSKNDRFGQLLGRSVRMREVFAVLERVAATDATVLIEGETGTGKELAAEGIHEASNRAGHPFVVFDCSAVVPQLMESELFGHVAGSFTGAVGDRVGAAEEADGGTLFLDEIGELPIELQPKLLRLLEKREVRRVGSNTVKKVDVRVIAATHRDIGDAVNTNLFRADLYYRLAVVHVLMPALREHRDDIPLYVAAFLKLLRASGIDRELPDGTAQTFMEHHWPGNVRELRNAVERAVSLASLDPAADQGTSAEPQSFTPLIDLDVPLHEMRTRLIADLERAYVTEALRATGGNVTQAAERAGVNRRYLQRVMSRLNMRARDVG